VRRVKTYMVGITFNNRGVFEEVSSFTLLDGIRGMDGAHALENAEWNWPDATDYHLLPDSYGIVLAADMAQQ